MVEGLLLLAINEHWPMSHWLQCDVNARGDAGVTSTRCSVKRKGVAITERPDSSVVARLSQRLATYLCREGVALATKRKKKKKKKTAGKYEWLAVTFRVAVV